MSTKGIAEKLLIKPDANIWASPPDRLALVSPLPEGVRPVEAPAEASVALVFADDAGSLRATLDAHRDASAQPATCWVAYPKANRTDFNRDSRWPILSEYGMRPIGQVALDAVWSAMRFRLLKPGEVPFTGGR